MVNADYLNTRKYYGRPQAMIFSDNPGSLDNGLYVPDGTEFQNFIILSDHNRAPISFAHQRIENRVRMVNGRMRSYHIADKVNVSTTWQNLPSRSASSRLVINEQGQTFIGADDLSYVLDNGAGAMDILDWYEKHQGSFWVFLAYDKFNNFENEDYEDEAERYSYDKMGQYNEIIEVFFSDFQHDVSKRGQASHDFWDISLTLEEV